MLFGVRNKLGIYLQFVQYRFPTNLVIILDDNSYQYHSEKKYTEVYLKIIIEK